MSGILKHSLLKKFDGSGRQPRPLQVEALGWVADNWSSPGLVIQAGTGTGKQAIARALQIATGGAILVPNNALVDQAQETYPNLNTLKGAEHYKCGIGGDHEDCTDCGYAKAKQRARSGEPTLFNPLSYVYSGCYTDTVIVDEAHKLEGFLRLLITYKFSQMKYSPPKNADAAWVARKAQEYNRIGSVYKERKEMKKAAQAFQQGKRLGFIADQMKAKPSDFVTYFDDQNAFVVEPIEVSREVFERALGKAKKVILLSATIPPRWAAKVLGHRSFKYLDMPSPIPKENRKVLYRPAGLTAKSTPLEVAQWIKKQLEEYKGNAIVHTTYSMGLELAKFFPDALVHTKQTKQSTLSKFKQDGGLWIAAGASEGIDLAGDSGRVNLIPILPFANNRNPLGSALFERDPFNYYLETAVTFIQMAGRTTRGSDDWSVTVCGDNRLSWLLQKCDKELPKYFKEQIQWR